MTDTLIVRDRLKAKLAELDLARESTVAELQSNSPFFKFFQFRMLKPRTKVLVYAQSHEEAEQKIARRLDLEYGPENWQLHPKVDVFDDPQQASGNSAMGSTLLECLTVSDAKLFLKHWQESQSVPDSRTFNSPGLQSKNRKRRPNSLERAVDEYERRLRLEELSARDSRKAPVK